MFAAQTPAVYADSTQDLIDALVTKGVLTEDEGALLGKGRKAEKKSEGIVKKGSSFELVSPDGDSNIKLSGRVQGDFRTFDIGNGDTGDAKAADTWDLRRAYLGVSGTYNKYYGYKVNLSAGSSTILDEAYVNFKWWKPANIQVGQFKFPMSLEERTSSRFLNFTERSYVNNSAITAGKEQGLMIFGSPTKGLNYGIGFANGYGQNVDNASDSFDDFQYIGHIDADFATMNKWKGKIAHIGFNYAFHDMNPDYIDDLTKQQTIGKGQEFFKVSTSSGGALSNLTKAERTNIGAELALASGPLKFQAEYAQASFDTNLGSEQDINTYYAEVGWLITGEDYSNSFKSKGMGGKFDRIKPNSNFDPETGKGIGAWEVMAGVSRFDAKDITSSSTGLRIASSDTSEADSWRLGLKFIPDPNSRIMISYINTDFDTAISTGNNSNIDDEKAVNIRFQYDF